MEENRRYSHFPSRTCNMLTKPSLSLAEARTIGKACEEAARQQNTAVSIAVVDDAGGLLYFLRMDGARIFTAELAIQKARTAASVGVPTSVIEDMLKDRPHPIRDLTPLRGGVPFLYDNQCAGAIGISGAKVEIDVIIAESGIASLSRSPTPGT
jgi:glc operon protein GlcG